VFLGILTIMNEPFGPNPERSTAHFTSPTEELEYLRAQVAEKERQLAERGHTAEKHALAYEEIQKYKETPIHSVIPERNQISRSEVDLLVRDLNLPPDKDDAVMEELVGILHEKGIKNALLVAEQLKSPHIEDDFHRLLIQYVAHGFSLHSLNEKNPLWQVLHMTLFEVTLPEPTQEEGNKPLREVVSVMEQFYLGMFSVDGPQGKSKNRYYSMEIAVSGESEHISFYMAVPSDKEDLFEKHLLSVFPKARVHHAPSDYNVFLHDGVSAVSYAKLKEDAILPLKDYREFDQDPLSVLVNTLTKLRAVGEGASIQCIINPVGNIYTDRYTKVLEKLEKGSPLQLALINTPLTMQGEVIKTFRNLLQPKQKTENEEPPVINQKLIEQVQKKIETPIPSINIRIVASAETKQRAETILSDIESSFNQLYNTSGNQLVFTRLLDKKAKHLMHQFTFREYSEAHALPLSVREISTIMHFPTYISSATPQLKRVRAAQAPAPIGLPQSGTLLGVNEYRGTETHAYLTPEDRLRHLYVIGQTGVGKTSFIKNLIQQDIENGDGVCFIDPHGSDIEDILSKIPDHRIDDVIYFDPSNTQHVIGLNMLEYDPRYPEQKTFVINELFSIFQKLYSGTPESMGPAFEQYFRNATALVLEDPSTGSTMLDISRVLADARFRELKLSRSKNPVVNQFWNEIATKAQGEASLQNMVPYITNKFDIFTANDIMRPIIAQQQSSFRMREVMDSRKILLVNLSKGKLGEINANLLGMVLVGKILMAALSRVDALASDLPPFYLYIDEFQNITTNSISAILSEARKYKLSLNIAHQYIAQLDTGIRDSVFGNVGSMAIFRVGNEDASFLEAHLQPTFLTQDIMSIENYHAYVRLLANGTPQKPFSIRVLPPKKGSPDKASYVKGRSTQTYGRPKSEIDRDVQMRYGIG
jgi:GTPase SAR1 family protein